MGLPITVTELRAAIRSLPLAGRAVCVHASLRSFGRLEGGADALIDAFLAEDCTLMVPTFSAEQFLVDPPPELRRERNGWDYESRRAQAPERALRFVPLANDVRAALGVMPATVLSRPDRVRGHHPLWSFTAIGPHAATLVGAQATDAATDPLRKLRDLDGSVVLIGVGLNRCSLLHHAEELAGRSLFYRWALDHEGKVVECQVGGCSEGFGRLWAVLEAQLSTTVVGQSQWVVLSADHAARAAASAIYNDPAITHCGRVNCDRCDDAVAGGPLPMA